jgi:PST family polysaccharide transporter
MKDLKQRTIRGGFAKILAQANVFCLRLGSVMILARLLEPKDFGLVGMVTAATGVLNLFRDFGLSMATVQRATVTNEQFSALFWVNMLVGAILAMASFILAPAVAFFYHEPRLVAITMVLALGFVFNAAGVQHTAILERQMRFTTLAVIDVVSLAASVAVGIIMAVSGYRYWALAFMTIALPLVSTIGLWLSTSWIPGKPRRHVGIRSMLRFGGTLTLNGLVVYMAYNLDKVLLGRFWGAEALGIYGRAYQLNNIPIDNLNSAVGGVAFSALSRVQDDPIRFRSYFLKGYSLVLGLTIPTTIACALFANDLILVVLGAKWTAAVPIFRFLAPTIFVFALINPLGWAMFALGMVERSLKVALVLAPLVIMGYLIGLPHGPRGVALGFSGMMLTWAIPHIAWCLHGTVVPLKDVMRTVSKPLLSGLAAAGLAIGLQSLYLPFVVSPFGRLMLGSSILFGTYSVVLMYVMGEKRFYFELVRGLWTSRSTRAEASLASA